MRIEFNKNPIKISMLNFLIKIKSVYYQLLRIIFQYDFDKWGITAFKIYLTNLDDL